MASKGRLAGVAREFGKSAWRNYLFLNTILIVVLNFNDCIGVFEQFRPVQMLEDLGVTLVCAAIIYVLVSRPFFQWWIGRLFERKRKRASEDAAQALASTASAREPKSSRSPGNFDLLPITQGGRLGAVYLALFTFALPMICRTEEDIFRKGTTSWPNALLRSLLFGFSHMLVGVPIGAALGLSVAGLWLTFWYFHGGVAVSTVHHTAYDVWVMLALAVMLSMQFRQRRRERALMPEPFEEEDLVLEAADLAEEV